MSVKWPALTRSHFYQEKSARFVPLGFDELGASLVKVQSPLGDFYSGEKRNRSDWSTFLKILALLLTRLLEFLLYFIFLWKSHCFLRVTVRNWVLRRPRWNQAEFRRPRWNQAEFRLFYSHILVRDLTIWPAQTSNQFIEFYRKNNEYR